MGQNHALHDSLTCRIKQPGERYFHQRRKAVVTVPKDQLHIVCEACEYVVSLPMRVYFGQPAEDVRKRHLNAAHFTDMREGRVRITEQLPQIA